MNELATAWLMVLLRTTVFLSGAALVVGLMLRFARPASPVVHRTAWLLVLLTGWFWWRLPVAIPCGETVAANMPSVMRAVTTQLGNQPYADMDQATFVGRIAPADSPLPRQLPTSEGLAAAVRANWPAAVLGVWLSGMFGLTVAWAVSYVRSLRQLHAAGPADAAWARQWDDLCTGHGIRERIPFRVTENVGPLLCRMPRGYLLVAPALLWQRLAPTERLSILQHELAHWKRCDLLKSTLVRLLMLPHWFNPLSWRAAGWFDEAAEWACDEVAKGASVDGRREYAKALLELDAVFGPRLSHYAAASGRGLSVRVQRLLNSQMKEDSLMKKITILGTALGLALLCMVRLDLVAKEPAEKGPAENTLAKPVAVDLAAELGDKLTEGQRFPRDVKLNEVQRAMRDVSEYELSKSLSPSRWQNLGPKEKAAEEEQWLKQLSSESESVRSMAIYALTVLESKKAVPLLLQIASERKEKGNGDRLMACRALGIVGDLSVVPDLVQLTYHFNRDTRLWAQISLVRLTGENFGRDVAAWRQWWDKQGGKPPISEEIVAWATSPEMIEMLGKWGDPKNYDEFDRQLIGQPGSPIVGIGVAIEKVEDRVVVHNVLAGTPAEAARLQPGDELRQIDEQPAKGDLEEVVKRIRGAAGTVVKIKVRKKDGTEVDLALPRRSIPHP